MANHNPNRDSKGKFSSGPNGKPLPAEQRERRKYLEKKRRAEDPVYSAKERERLRLYHYVRMYGMTYDQITELRLKQDNKCALCFLELPEESTRKGYKGFVVDHNHHTGKVRGIIHQKCNVALGSLGDTVEGVMKAVKYLTPYDNTSEMIEEHW